MTNSRHKCYQNVGYKSSHDREEDNCHIAREICFTNPFVFIPPTQLANHIWVATHSLNLVTVALVPYLGTLIA